tara:strand:+ start:224 stop:1159 length:936 start_codon:yes stop_codon:yes gene_type:complete
VQKVTKHIIKILYYFIYYSGIIYLFRLANDRNVILFYHYVNSGSSVSKKHRCLTDNIDKTSAETLSSHINYLQKYYKLSPLGDLVKMQENRHAAITFDDGFRSVYDYFSSRNDDIPFTIFLNTYFYDKKIGLPLHNVYGGQYNNNDKDMFTGTIEKMHKKNLKIWNTLSEKAKDEISKLYLTLQDIEHIKNSKNITIGGHSHSHRSLKILTKKNQKEEITLNKSYLEKIFDREIKLFAYPFGVPDTNYDEETISIIRNSGYEFSFSAVNYDSYNDNNLSIPRFWGGDKPVWYFACEIERVLPNLKKLFPSF